MNNKNDFRKGDLLSLTIGKRVVLGIFIEKSKQGFINAFWLDQMNMASCEEHNVRKFGIQ